MTVALAKDRTAADNQVRQWRTGENNVQFNSHPYVYIVMNKFLQILILFRFYAFISIESQWISLKLVNIIIQYKLILLYKKRNYCITFCLKLTYTIFIGALHVHTIGF